MANILPIEKQVSAISMICEGSSIRSVERVTGVHRDTIMRLALRVGENCEDMMNKVMVNLPCSEIQVDEIWGFIAKKDKQVVEGDSDEKGSVWTWIACDPTTKLVPTFVAGKRDYEHAYLFIRDVKARMANRIQLSSDGLDKYLSVVDDVFASQVDYGQCVKQFETATIADQRKYSLPDVVSVERKALIGNPDMKKISTSIVERQNLTLRMHNRRLTRLTNGFSKKYDNFRASLGLYFAYYNFVKVHSSLRCTPAMAAGVSNRLWTVKDLIEVK